MKQNPLFSIIIPTFNRAEELKNAIKSVLNQQIEDFEIIIIDDASTDHTKSIIEQFTDNRIFSFSKSINEERAKARNFGIKKAKGDYITFLDSDDVIYSNFLSEGMKLIKKFNNPEWMHLAYEIRDNNGKLIERRNRRKNNLGKSLLSGNHLSCVGIIIRKDIIKKNHFNEDPVIIGSEDYLLWLKLSFRYILRFSNTVCASVFDHSSRSVRSFNSERLINRIEKSISFVINDPEFQSRSKKDARKFIAHRYIYLSLHLILNKDLINGMKYWDKSFRLFPQILFSRKNLGIIKVFLKTLLESNPIKYVKII